MFHTSQFFIDTILADRHREKYFEAELAQAAAETEPSLTACEQ